MSSPPPASSGVIPTLTNGGRPFGIIEHVVTASAFRRQA